MSIPGSAEPLLLAQQDATATGYQIQRSLRFNSSDSAYLSRTPASAGNRNTWTWAGWVKRSDLGNALNYTLFSSTTDSYDLSYNQIQFEAGNKIRLKFADGGIITLDLTTNAVFRDASAWYHILIAVDTTQSAQQSRVSIYINGALQALTGTYPGQNANTIFNKAFAPHHLAGSPPISEYFSGLLADVFFIDGQALTPSSFVETSATTGQLIPKAYTGTFGTNGFWLKFSDNSAATATTLGKDYSGNSNNWTPNNLSVTAGAGNDSLVDTPTSAGTDTGVGGQVTGNYATWNPLDTLAAAAASYTNGNLNTSYTTANYTGRATIGVTSGKWYWEILVTTSGNPIGLATAAASTSNYPGQNSSSWGYYGDTGNKYNNGSATSYGASFTTNDVVGVAFDADNGTLTFYKNGTSQGTAFTGLTSGPYFPAIGNGVYAVNFGQRPFAYTAPSGFKALVDTNIPVVIAKPNSVFDVKLYTGNGSTQTISGLGFSPDLVWIKKRSGSEWHCINDTVRGAELYLSSNTTNAESGANNVLTAFTSTGYTVGSQGIVNDNGFTFASWCWDAGSSTVTNTQGSITSQVRANASAGFSIVTYSGTGSAATVGHGLGVAPRMVIVKRRNGGGTENWMVYHASITSPSSNPAANRVLLNLTNASNTDSAIWNDTQPTSTVFSVGTSSEVNANTGTYVAYCFAPVAGYASSFSITGNGSIGGPFCFLGFRPRLILLKRTDTTANWLLLDTAREGYNVDNDPLWPNLSNAEGITDLLDITSNGFKVRSTDAQINANTGTYVGFAWAEYPFQYARAR